jgi:tetratricopeptide (TPR) repeat protein
LAAFVTDILRRRTLAGPVVLLVEDCQWVDPPSRDLLVAIARDTGRAHIVLVMTSRAAEGDEAHLGWARSLPDRTDVTLQPLVNADVERLARRTLRKDFDVASAADEVVGLLMERADGNPFVLEETLHLLHDRGIDPRDPQAVKSSGLPDSVHSLVLARLDTLSSDEYATLKAASVIGRTFDADWLGRSFPDLGRAADIASQLNRLHELALIEPEGFRAGNVYRFRHALVHDVAYGTLSISHRQDLHEQVGRMLESTDLEDVDRYVDLLAYHFGASRAVDKQRVYFRKAADAARASFSNEVAIAWFDRLLPLCDPKDASDVLREAGEVRQLIGDWSGAEAAFQRAIELAERAANPLAAARSQCSLGHLRTYTGSLEEARRFLEAANSTFEQASDDHGQLRTLEYLAFVAAESADYESSLAWSQKHLELAQRVGDAIAVCMATEQAGLAQWHRGDYVEAREHLARALSSAEEIGYLRGVILTANDLAGLSAEEGDHVGAFSLVCRALVAAREMGYHHAIGVLVGNAGELYRQHGDIARALTSASKGLTTSARLGDRADVATKAGNIALALLDHQMDAEVDLFLDAGEDLARATDDRYALCECLQLRAELLTRRGLTEDARKWNEKALAVATEIGRHDVRFAAELLDIRLRFALQEVDGPRAADALADLDGPATSERERAAIDHTVWRLTGSEVARDRAAEQFRSLHEMIPNVLYRRRYEELTGDRLPEPKPLPPLPGEDEQAPQFIEALPTAQKSLNESRRLMGS